MIFFRIFRYLLPFDEFQQITRDVLIHQIQFKIQIFLCYFSRDFNFGTFSMQFDLFFLAFLVNWKSVYLISRIFRLKKLEFFSPRNALKVGKEVKIFFFNMRKSNDSILYNYRIKLHSKHSKLQKKNYILNPKHYNSKYWFF